MGPAGIRYGNGDGARVDVESDVVNRLGHGAATLGSRPLHPSCLDAEVNPHGLGVEHGRARQVEAEPLEVDGRPHIA